MIGDKHADHHDHQRTIKGVQGADKFPVKPPATAPTRYADGKSKARADRRANSFAYWRWQAIDIRSLKISTSSTASISTRKTGPRAEKPSARTCGTRSAAALAEAVFRAQRL